MTKIFKQIVKWQIFVLICLVPFILAEDNPDDDAEVVDTQTTTKDNEDWLKTLTKEKCDKRRKGCCEQMYLGDEEALMKCFALHQTQMPDENEKDPAKVAKFLSCFVECVYKQKKFIGKGENINMKMVKADAEKTYHDRPKEKDYYIKMMDYCRKDDDVKFNEVSVRKIVALKLYNLVRLNPAGAILLRDACKPFFLFVFLCQVEYPKRKSCPYFVWEGKAKSAMEEQCRDGKDKCYEMNGILLP